MNDKQIEFLDMILDYLNLSLEHHLQSFLEYTLKERDGDLVKYHEKRIAAITLAKTVLKSYQKELKREDK